MAIIGKIREKTGLLVGVVAFSLVLFLLGADFLSPNSGIFGRQSNAVGEIDGEEIDLKDYNQEVDRIKYLTKVSTGQPVDDQNMANVRNQAWTRKINDIAYHNQYEKVGLEVTDEEYRSFIRGENLTPQITNVPFFKNQETGQFDRNILLQFLDPDVFYQQSPELRFWWLNFQDNIKESRYQTKYSNLLAKADYVTKAEAKQEYLNSSTVANIKYLYVPFYSVNDSVVRFNKRELMEYLRENQTKYEREESRGVNYVSFPVIPSIEDSAAVLEEAQELAQEMYDSPDDSIFAAVKSDVEPYYITVTPNELPDQLKDLELAEGLVHGPILDGEYYSVFKVSSVSAEGAPVARASHILFKSEDDTDEAKAEARNEANKILTEIKGGADFAEMARVHGTDGTASKGGDLGFFGENQMVKPFEEAVFEAKQEGLLPKVVETDFGFHIIEVTKIKSSIEYEIAVVKKQLYASDVTRNDAYRQAEMFASSVSDITSFKDEAREQSIVVKTAASISKNANQIPGLSKSRTIISWLYRDAEMGSISEVMDLDNQYVIAAMTEHQKEGIANLESVRLEIERKVKEEKKAQYIIDNLSSQSGSLEEIRTAYGSGANIYTMDNLNLSSNSLSGAGFSPDAVGIAFSLNDGETTAPFKGENGVLIIEMISKTVPDEALEYDSYKDQISRRRQNRIGFGINQVVEEYANIEDNRYRFQ